jgi:uncharacterized protein YdbL (DUF1318 family)
MGRILLSAAVLGLAACQGPTVSLSTPEPIVVDINMRVDVYERGGTGTGAANAKTRPSGDAPAADARRRARMGDIQTFKNSRLVGENRQGLLVVREQPAGAYGQYVAKIVAEENTDRLVLMRQLAAERTISLEDVQKQQGELWRNRSFSGELIEVPQDSNTWLWAQTP